MKSTLNNSNQSWWHHHLLLVPLLVSALFSCTTAQNSNNNNVPPSPYGLDANFNPSMAIIIVVLISAFFFMGFFSIYIRQCAGEGRTDRSIRPATNQTGRSRRAQRGLDPSVIETFPTFAYSIVKGLKIGKGALECAVCLNEFEDDETLRLLPKCDHVFHPECIDAWLVSHITCPVCRANLTPDSTTTNTTCSDDEDEHEENETNENENEISVSVAAAEDEQETETEAAAATATATVPQPEVYINPSSIPIQNRPARSKSSTRPRIRGGKFPRSHSTGHSLIQPGENCDRFTLRLPEDIRKQIMLSRTKSSFPVVGDGSFSRRSSRRGYRGSGGESGSSRGGGKYYQMWKLDRSQSQSQRAKSDRWVFSMAPPFLSRTGSVRSPKGGVNGEDEGSVNSRNIFKTPFDCLSPRVNGGGQATSSSSSTRLPV